MSTDDRHTGGVTPQDEWRRTYDEAPKRDVDAETMSGVPLEPVYGPDALRGLLPE